jgi:DNA modification methylase
MKRTKQSEAMETNTIYNENCIDTLRRMPDGFVQCCITSPPYYGLRDYGNADQIGLEETPEAYVQKLVEVFRDVKRALRDDGTLWLNLGDSYANTGNEHPNKTRRKDGDSGEGVGDGHMVRYKGQPKKNIPKGLKPKDLIGIPWMVAFALRADGWYLRQDIIWHKPNPMPESVTDRCTKAHEYIFLMSKSQRYYYDAEAVKEGNADPSRTNYQCGAGSFVDKTRTDYHSGRLLTNSKEMRSTGRNKRSVWTVSTRPYSGAHFATFPEKLIEPCVLAGSPEQGIIYDPFMGAGTTALVSLRANRRFVGSELNPEYCKIANKRIKPLLTQYNLFT